MLAAQFTEQLSDLRARLAAQTLSASDADVSARAAAQAILDAWQTRQPYPRAAATWLCELATAAQPAYAQAGVAALFPQLIETLNDSFSPTACALYDELFAQVIEFCRRLPEGAPLDARLRACELFDEAGVLARRARLARVVPATSLPKSVRKILLLARVTIGADVAVTSVLAAHLREVFPEAELVWLGSAKLRELFGGDPRMRVRELVYERGGGLLARLNSWLAVVAAVEAETQGAQPREVLVIDPDSRLTQLGLLPAATHEEERYFYFPSRAYRPPGVQTIAQLAAHWCHAVFGPMTNHALAYPQLALPSATRVLGEQLAARSRRGGARTLLTVSLGVGGNERKRVSEEFEDMLLADLLARDGLAATVLLDQGGNAAERAQVKRLLDSLRALGRTIVEAREQDAVSWLARERIEADVIAWEGGIGSLAGLMAASDGYVGYDSAGQHLAAALGVPGVTIFVNGNTPAFAERWRPSGQGRNELVLVAADDLERGAVTADAVLAEARGRLVTLLGKSHQHRER